MIAPDLPSDFNLDSGPPETSSSNGEKRSREESLDIENAPTKKRQTLLPQLVSAPCDAVSGEEEDEEAEEDEDHPSSQDSSASDEDHPPASLSSIPPIKMVQTLLDNEGVSNSPRSVLATTPPVT